MVNAVVISKNVQLTSRLVARKIYVSSGGEVYLSVESFGPNTKVPELTVEYLEALCSKFYYGGYAHHCAIADIMLLNGYISTHDYGDFYSRLRRNTAEQRVTVISSDICQ